MTHYVPSFLGKTPPQQDADTTGLHIWDGNLNIPSFPPFPPNVMVMTLIMAKHFKK